MMAATEEYTIMTVKLSMWKALAFPLSKFMLGYLAVMLYVAYLAFIESGDWMLQYGFYAILAVYLLIYFGYILRVRKRRIELTNKRIIDRQGRAMRQLTIIPLAQIATMKVQATRMGRRLNFGNIIFETPSLTTVTFNYVTRPFELVDAIFDLQ